MGRRVTARVAVMMTVLVGIVGCGGSTDAETTTETRAPVGLRSMDITVDGLASPENLGVLMAQRREYTLQNELDVFLHYPVSPRVPIQYVANGEVNLAVAHEPQVVMAQEKGTPVVAVASLVSQPTAAMIWLKKANIGGIGDLKGKTIAIPGLSFEKSLLQNLLDQAGLTLDDVKVEPVGFELVPALVSGRADAIFGGSWNVEGIELEQLGLRPQVTRVGDLGVPSYDELVLVTNRDQLASDPQLVRDYIAVMLHGAESAIEDPKAAANLVAARVGDPNRAAIAKETDATLPMLSTTGYLDPDQAGELVDWMYEEGLIQEKPAVADFLSNDYLPAEP